jgi:hypothetical protein
MTAQAEAPYYFVARHGGLCDRCDALVCVGDTILRTEGHELICGHCGVMR